MYKAAFLDMDGTLLRTDHSVSEPTKQTIRNLIARGIPVVLVSARPLDAMLPTAREIGLAEFPLVSLNGGYIVEQEQPIFQAMVGLDATASVTEETRPFGATIAYYLQREWFAETSNSWTQHEQKIMDVKVQILPFPEMARLWAAKKTGPNKMMLMNEPDAIAAAEAHLKSVFGDTLNIYTSKPTYLEVMDPRGSKSNAVSFLIKRMGLDKSEVVAMGDNYNDREMIRFAGMGVAMGNAPDEIKAAAAYTTDTNNNDGVRKALEKFFP
ncbi:MAG TPA: Cof-type HAD-IIB family hydrolase [Puia sp.]|nr:Cof-type HAD-IIB family hydrolase [Puia sp.]